MLKKKKICKKNALIIIKVPHPRHEDFLSDPTHVRPITVLGLSLFDQKLNKEWQKNILHFGGSSDSAELAYIKTWLSSYENTIEDSLFGGFVHNYSQDPMSSSLNNADFIEVKGKLEEGVSLITFLQFLNACFLLR